MIERLSRGASARRRAGPGSEPPPNRMTFTDLGISRLRPPKEGQRLYWDVGQKGLALLVSSGGTKTFRSQFKLHGQVADADPRSLRRDEAEGRQRERQRRDRAGDGPQRPGARQGRHRPETGAAGEAKHALTYGEVVDQFIEQYAKRRQRTWDQTEYALKGSAGEQRSGRGIARWLRRPIASITKTEAYDLLEGMIADGHGPKASVTLSWLRTLWKWAYKRDIVDAPTMEKVEIEVEKRSRTKVFDDDAIRATWRPADKLDPVEGAFVKLIVLLAPRKTALAEMRRSHLDDAGEPDPVDDAAGAGEAVAARRAEGGAARVPDAAAAARGPDHQVSAEAGRGRRPASSPAGRRRTPISPTGPLHDEAGAAGAPADFQYHAWRHTIATWLQKQGHDEFDRGLILNHAEAGVTAGYSHSYALERKRDLLEEWSAHVESLVTPEGVTMLR